MSRRDLMLGIAASAMALSFAACTANGTAASDDGDDDTDEGRDY